MDTVFYITVTLLALIGFGAIVTTAVHMWFSRRSNSKIVDLILLYGDDGEIMLREAIEQLNWGSVSRKLIAVDMGLCEQSRSVCDILCGNYMIPLITPEALSEILTAKM